VNGSDKSIDQRQAWIESVPGNSQTTGTASGTEKVVQTSCDENPWGMMTLDLIVFLLRTCQGQKNERGKKKIKRTFYAGGKYVKDSLALLQSSFLTQHIVTDFL
jgi:hypothetical protein